MRRAPMLYVEPQFLAPSIKVIPGRTRSNGTATHSGSNVGSAADRVVHGYSALGEANTRNVGVDLKNLIQQAAHRAIDRIVQNTKTGVLENDEITNA